MAPSNPTRYWPLNPFVELSVEEKHLWGCVPLRDVSEIHASAVSHLNEAFDAAQSTGRSQCCLLEGAPGSGKTHLLARLQQIHANSSLFAYLPLTPVSPETFIATTLLHVMRCLDQPARTERNEAADFTQLQKLAYALLMRVVEQDVSIEQLHESWIEHTLEERQELVNEATTVLKEENPDAPEGLITVLLSTLLPDRRSAATQWLGGSAYATAEALALIGVETPLPRADHILVLDWLGHLAQQAKLTVVLALDDWDLTPSSASMGELPQLLTCLLERSRHWVVLITICSGAVTDARKSFNSFLPEGCTSLDEKTPNNENFWFALLKPLTPGEQWMLLERYLGGKSLAKQRKADWIASSLHPFSSQDILELTERQVSPREVLTKAGERYQNLLHAPSDPLPLRLYLGKLWHDQIAWAATSRLPSALEVGERLADLLRLITKDQIQVHRGNLNQFVSEFDGADWNMEIGRQRFRVVTSHATGHTWDQVLAHLMQETTPVLLCRYARFPILDQPGRDCLEPFQSGGHAFHWVDAAEWHALSALSRMLHSFRIDRFQDINCHPLLTPHHFSITLRKVMRARQMPIIRVLRCLGRRQRGRPFAEDRTSSTESTVSPTRADLVALTQSILQEERWIELTRLQRRLADHGTTASTEEITAALTSEELIGHISFFPSHPQSMAQPQFFLWTHEA